ncbi:MAG: class II aldolase/adducin family protein [Ardenticatenaceae bacterium]|nr:class II aldolase/adducin family protein [Ardenticatenaceae bacterium]MCB9445612.1 class II aldolase/adducin family protein [Ardenticatenaceae bacterium]
MNFQLLHPRDQLVAIMNRIYHNGMTTLSGGNLSIKDDNGDIWITPSGIDKGTLTPKDIMCVQTNGTIIGPHKPSIEFPFHRKIYELRPDFQAIVHAHPPALVSFSIVRKVPDTRIIPQANRICGPVGYAPYALPGSQKLGENIANTFAEGYNIIILENHGMAAGGSSLLDAFHRLETLDFCARTLIRAQALGDVKTLSEPALNLFDHRHNVLPEFVPTTHSSRERELRQQIVDITARAYDRHLMISTEGVVSARLDDDSFLITPTGHDRRTLAVEDVVLVRHGVREAGKLPSRSVKLHEAIYARHPDVNCVMTAQCPNATAYAITSGKFDSRTIPESFILLRDIPLIPFKMLYTQAEAVAEIVSLSTPVAMVENDCVLTVGTDVMNAFDRLEVAEYSARSLIDTAVLGPLVPIGDTEIHDLEIAFSLT